MTLPQLLEQELLLRSQSGPAGACVLSLTDSAGHRLELDLAALDSLSCSLNELRLQIPGLASRPQGDVQKWAEALSKKITYLLEQIAPVEFDASTGEALIRSTNPSQLPQGSVYYELRLKSRAGNSVTLNRFRFTAGQPGRQQVTLQLTHEVLVRLVQDLLDTLPGTP